MSHIKPGVVRQFGKDAIHFDLIEGHEWGERKQHFKEKIQAFKCVAVFVNVWNTYSKDSSFTKILLSYRNVGDFSTKMINDMFIT